MYAKLLDKIINLDLIRRITQVKSGLTTNISWEIHGNDINHLVEYNLTKEKELDWLRLSTTGDEYQREYLVIYFFEIIYLKGDKEKVIVGSSRAEAERVREKFAEFLNGNKPIIHVIE